MGNDQIYKTQCGKGSGEGVGMYLIGCRATRRRGVVSRSTLGRIAAVILVSLLAGLPAISAFGEGKAGTVDSGELIKFYEQLMAGPAFDPKTPLGPGQEERGRAEAELDAAKRAYARARTDGNQEALAVARDVLRQKTEALQTLYGKTTQDLRDVAKYRSREILIGALRSRIQEFGQAQGFDIINNQQTGKPMFLREGFSGASDNPVDVTAEMIEWIRQQEEAARSGRATRP